MRGRRPSRLSSLPGLRLDGPTCPTDKSVGYCRSVPAGTQRFLNPSAHCQRVRSQVPSPLRPWAVSRSPIWPPTWPPMATLDGRYEFGESLVVASWCQINHLRILRRNRILERGDHVEHSQHRVESSQIGADASSCGFTELPAPSFSDGLNAPEDEILFDGIV